MNAIAEGAQIAVEGFDCLCTPAVMIHRKTEFALDRPRTGGLLAAYFPVNDPLVPLELLAAYDVARVDVVELGVKTPDPYADGEVVAASMLRATGTGTVSEAADAINAVRQFRHDSLGMIFGYAEPKLAPDPAIWRDVDGLLALGASGPDTDKITRAAAQNGTRITRFVPYDLPCAAVTAARTATGFVFLHYTDGKTGIRTALDERLPERVAKLRDAGVCAPIMAGIGISTVAQVDHAMQSGADGVVVGSKAVQKAVEGRAALEDYLCNLREVLDG